jgi:hypothetical protein
MLANSLTHSQRTALADLLANSLTHTQRTALTDLLANSELASSLSANACMSLNTANPISAAWCGVCWVVVMAEAEVMAKVAAV